MFRLIVAVTCLIVAVAGLIYIWKAYKQWRAVRLADQWKRERTVSLADVLGSAKPRDKSGKT